MKDLEQSIFLKLKKREQKILNNINKSEKPVPIPVILNNIGEMVYKHDPHAPEQSKLNLVIEDYLMESVEHLPPAAPFVIELHFKELSKTELDTAALPDILNKWGTVKSTSITIYGICNECLKNS